MMALVSHTIPNLDIVTQDFESANTLSEKLAVLGVTSKIFGEFPTSRNPKLLFKYPYKVPKNLIDIIESKNIINLHNGKLPEYRGFHALSWMIESGEEKGCLTLHQVEEQLDAGAIVSEYEFEITKCMDINDARDHMNLAILNWVPFQIKVWLMNRENILRPRSTTISRLYPKKGDDNFLNFDFTIEQAENKIRAVNPPYGPGVIYENEAMRARLCNRYGEASTSYIKKQQAELISVPFSDGELIAFCLPLQ
jgi:methionyl-tRNA formyltransferase